MSANSGRVEVRYHGQLGTVCRSGWDMKDAEVVCRMLGYPGVQEYKTTNFTPVKGIIWLKNVGCTGREMFIGNCSHGGWGRTYCYHWEDVGVTCKMGNVLFMFVVFAFRSVCACFLLFQPVKSNMSSFVR
jgi:hypothetical protein